jgi:hypothetical protein
MKTNYAEILGEELLKKMETRYKGKIASTRGRVDKAGNPIEMRLSFDEWLTIWMDSGKIDSMGSGRGGYVLCRVGDLGHYEVGNVFVASGLDNVLDAYEGLDEMAKNINEICLRTGYKRSAVKGLIKRGLISIESDGSVTVH